MEGFRIHYLILLSMPASIFPWCFQSEMDKLIDRVHEYGYEIEVHTMTTSDGYILNMFRIPTGKLSCDCKKNKTAVLLEHGVFASGGDFFAAGEKAIVYMLADAGFDVWVSNSRGTVFSREHFTLNPECDEEYWDFSWHEIAIHDIPAMIDYILELTKKEKLFFIGHSEGTTVFFVMLSEKPEYNDKIILNISLAPVAFLSNLGGFFGLLKPILLKMFKMFQFIGLYEFKRSFLFLLSPICKISPIVCATIIFTTTGFDYKEIDSEQLRTYFDYHPGGCSMKQLHHYAQIVVNGEFCQFDYGESTNLDRYGTETPPEYNLENITAPITFVYGENDYYTPPSDLDRLLEKVKNSDKKNEIKMPSEKWNHLDFIISKNIDKLNEMLIDEMNNYL